MCKKINNFFVGLTSPLLPLTFPDVFRISVDVILEELFSSVREVQGAINSIKVRKSPGLDGILNIILESFSFKLAPVICKLYNSSLREGFIPPLLKSACVRPLPKKRPAQSVNHDIRPISLTCQISKVMEGLTLSRLAPAVLADLDAKQFATRGKSTEQAIAYILHVVLENLDCGNCPARLFFADF